MKLLMRAFTPVRRFRAGGARKDYGREQGRRKKGREISA